ncbi:MAG: hypothetical protein JWO67_3187 [Streptosporangiaceae bacterium]|nr:hypothetical protein [Streptosporangiaceae bacterium]
MPVVQLGNPAPTERGVLMPGGPTITEVVVPDSHSIDQAVRDIAYVDPTGGGNSGLWASHSDVPAPSWVSCPDDPDLQAALAARYGCPAGRPAQ